MNAWRPALEWLAELLLYAAEVFPGLHTTYGNFTPSPHQITVENQYPLPEDESEEKALDLSEVSNKTRSIRSYLMKWGGPDSKGLDADDADTEFIRIVEEQRKMEDTYTTDETDDLREDE